MKGGEKIWLAILIVFAILRLVATVVTTLDTATHAIVKVNMYTNHLAAAN
ncbi:hypothetical protein L3i20_v221940 [Paenibacillus sp. L3-i20]|nr:hypothetical protein L3i20_v221940 [Paenibacillus sp. L3-i20]